MNPTSAMHRSVAVIGSGPAGSAAAVALAERGIEVTWIAADHERPWAATYCAWVDELVGSLIDIDAQPELTSMRWSGVTVTDEVSHRVDRGYVVFDNAALRDQLTRRAIAAGVTLQRGEVTSIHDRGGLARVMLRGGPEIDAVLVIDASGWPSVSGSGRGDAVAWQSAWGVMVRTDALPERWRMREPMLMDWRSAGGAELAGGATGATFAYALEIADGISLVEETALASRPALAEEPLRARLLHRLGWDGQFDDLVRRGDVVGTEQVRIPMGIAPLRPHAAVLAFGAAGGMVNPVTGYSVAASLREAPRLAVTVGEGVRARDTGTLIAQSAFDAIWPRSRRVVWQMQRYGLGALLRMDAAAHRDFFAAFFAQAEWDRYLSGAITPGETARLMGGMYRTVDRSTRRALRRGELRGLWDARRRSARRGGSV
ncbi:MAG: lycopene cyclase family protein [Acidimicrobiia bacterium]